MAVCVVTVALIYNCVVAPIAVVMFPKTETIQTMLIQRQPDVAWPQIIVSIPDQSHILVSVPSV